MTQCLIVDDDPDDQEIFLMCLKKVNQNVACRTANDGVEALELLRGDPGYTPHYIFIDVNMPRMNGLQCLEVMRGIDRLKASKIFMYSTTAESKALEESKRLGVEDFIIKPARTVDLKERLSQIFNIISENNTNTSN